MDDKKTIFLKKMMEKESEPFGLTFFEMSAIMDAILKTATDEILDDLFESKCLNCYTGIVNATLLREAFQFITEDIPEDWESKKNSERYDRNWLLGKISEIGSWLGVNEIYIAVEDTTFDCPHSETTDTLENEGRELLTQGKILTENVFKGVFFPNHKGK